MRHPSGSRCWLRVAAVTMLLLGAAGAMAQSSPAPPSEVQARDHSWDDGKKIDVTWSLSPDDSAKVAEYRIFWKRVLTEDVRTEAKRVAETARAEALWMGWAQTAADAAYEKKLQDEIEKMAPAKPTQIEESAKAGVNHFTVDDLAHGGQYLFEVVAVGKDASFSDAASTTQAVEAHMNPFDQKRGWLLVIVTIICGSVVTFIALARGGMTLKIRKIAGLEAVDEAVGRATEMGRPILFVPGIQDMNDIQTIAGLTVLARVAKTVAEYDAKLEVPTSKSLVMTAARETVQHAFLAAGRPDAFNEDLIYYVTDEQFGYVAYLTGHMARQKPAACFYFGAFFAESLILAETGNSIGAIQIAGTAEPSQLPFFVAACDYTLIGEEFFAASAYLSGEPEQLGSLKGQDVGKLIVGGFLVFGCAVATMASIPGVGPLFGTILNYLKRTMLT